MKGLVMTLLMWAFVATSGCCTKYVSQIGKTNADFWLADVSRDAVGNIVCKVNLTRIPVNGGHFSSLGQRYIILMATNVPMAFERAHTRYRHPTMRETSVMNETFPANEAEALSASDWFVYPADLLHAISTPMLPSYLATNSFERCARDPNPPGFDVPIAAHGTNYTLHIVNTSSDAWDHPDKIHQSIWGYPFRILYIPALAIDIVFYPVEYLVDNLWALGMPE